MREPKIGDKVANVIEDSYILVYDLDGPWLNIESYNANDDSFRYRGSILKETFKENVTKGVFYYVDDALDPSKCFIHDYKHYVGFTEIYDYCLKCDDKREHKDYYCSGK